MVRRTPNHLDPAGAIATIVREAPDHTLDLHLDPDTDSVIARLEGLFTNVLVPPITVQRAISEIRRAAGWAEYGHVTLRSREITFCANPDRYTLRLSAPPAA